jgi:hypothetical protein
VHPQRKKTRVATTLRTLTFTAVWRRFVPSFIVPLLALPAMAQQAPNMELIRRSTPISAIDRQSIQNWVNSRLDELFATPTPEEGLRLVTSLRQHYRAADATPAFREALAQIVAGALLQRYQPPAAATAPAGPRADLFPIVYTLMALREFRDAAALDAFQRMLTDPTPGIRLSALEGILAIRERLTGQQWAALLPDLQARGPVETDPVVLRRLYRVLSVTDGQRAQQIVPVMVAILNGRLTRLEQADLPPVPADGEAATWLGARLANVNDAQLRNNAILQIGRILADAVHAYINQQPDAQQREQLAGVIRAAEQQLKARITGRTTPDVTAALQTPAAGRHAAMSAELEKWIGAGGVLAQPPFNLPAGLNIRRPPPTATAPAPPG